jgi:hypothetical protein
VPGSSEPSTATPTTTQAGVAEPYEVRRAVLLPDGTLAVTMKKCHDPNTNDRPFKVLKTLVPTIAPFLSVLLLGDRSDRKGSFIVTNNVITGFSLPE